MNLVLQRFFALVVFVMVGCMLPLSIAAQTGFDDLPDPTAEAKQPTGVGDALPVTIDNTPDSIAKALMSRPAPGSTREGDNPVLFLIGNSTMRNGTRGDGSNGQWGWGFYASQFFNGRKISVENQALGAPWRIRRWAVCLLARSTPTSGRPCARRCSLATGCWSPSVTTMVVSSSTRDERVRSFPDWIPTR